MSTVEPEAYWEKAGEVGYAEAMFTSSEVERHVNLRLWQVAVDIGQSLGLTSAAHVLDLGCGDGAFANQMLAKHFDRIDGFDLSEAGIRRAWANAAKPGMRFQACDISRMELPNYDGAFLIGILHHVKSATPDIVRALHAVTSRVVVLEPNGNNLVRKLLELTPSYRAAGEDSFRTKQLRRIFEQAGYRTVVWRRLNLFPNFTPWLVFKALRPLERLIEVTPVLRALCTVNMFGFASDAAYSRRSLLPARAA